MSDEKDKVNHNLAIWDDSCKPPKTALKQIKGGRISGMTDINPQWRFHKLTELFGVAGEGWWIVETRREFVPCGDEIAVFVDVELHISGLTHPIQGNGGNVFRVNESRGLRLNDECIKMATTDAVSVCCKQLGIGSAIYEGKWDGSKYADDAPNPQPQAKPTKEVATPPKKVSTQKPVDKDVSPKFKFLDDCKRAKAFLGEEMYYQILGNNGFEKANEVSAQKDRDAIMGEMALAATAKKALEEHDNG